MNYLGVASVLAHPVLPLIAISHCSGSTRAVVSQLSNTCSPALHETHLQAEQIDVLQHAAPQVCTMLHSDT